MVKSCKLENRAAPIAVLGHVHAGTTCLAKILQSAGVTFSSICNELLEDPRIIGMYHTAVSYAADECVNTWQDEHTEIAKQVILSTEDEAQSSHWGFKHPLTSVVYPQWKALLPDLKCIAIIRSPESWTLTMDGLDAFGVGNVGTKMIEGGWYEQAGKEWLHCYKPILMLKKEINLPCILFGADDFESQVADALSYVGLEYSGGYDRKEIHQPHVANYIPESCKSVWSELSHGLC